MSLLDRLVAGLKQVIELDAKVERLGRATEGMQAELRQLDRRLIRVETALELASDGRFQPRRLARNDEPEPG